MRKIKKLVVVLNSVETKETLERWEFKIENEVDSEGKVVEGAVKDEKKIKGKIRDVIQTSSLHSRNCCVIVMKLVRKEKVIYFLHVLENIFRRSKGARKVFERSNFVQRRTKDAGILH